MTHKNDTSTVEPPEADSPDIEAPESFDADSMDPVEHYPSTDLPAIDVGESTMMPAVPTLADLARTLGYESEEELDCARYRDNIGDLLAALEEGGSLPTTARKVTIGGVGKSATGSGIALSLALVCAENGLKVLLVDGNGKKGNLHRRLQVSNHRGLSELLANQSAPHGSAHATEIPNLALMPKGQSTHSLANLIGRENVFHRIQPITQYFDYVILDASLSPASSLVRLGVGSDNVIVCAKKHETRMAHLESTLKALRNSAVPDPAVLLLE